MKTREEFIGAEFDWFAADAEGRIALFSSAGWGPVPDFVFEHFDSQQAILTQLCEFTGLTPLEKYPQAIRGLAAHGIFGYDWHDTYGPYRRQTIPVPARLTRLAFPDPLQAPPRSPEFFPFS